MLWDIEYNYFDFMIVLSCVLLWNYIIWMQMVINNFPVIKYVINKMFSTLQEWDYNVK